MKYFILLLFVTLCSCSSGQLVFSKKIIDEYQLTEDDVKSLQVYVSDDIYLEKIDEDEAKIKDGELSPNAKQNVESITIESGTPGIILIIDDDVLVVSFQKGSALIFSYVEDKYIISTKNGKVVYSGTEYNISEDSLNAHLLITKTPAEIFEKSQTVPGIELKDEK